MFLRGMKYVEYDRGKVTARISVGTPVTFPGVKQLDARLIIHPYLPTVGSPKESSRPMGQELLGGSASSTTLIPSLLAPFS
jgi:hypothetical protein